MKINPIDGSLSFMRGEIEPGMNRSQFLDSRLGRSAKAGLVNEPWRQYGIDPEAGIAGTIFFEGERLDRVFLAMALPGDAELDWTVERERGRKLKHDQWLRSELGEPPYDFGWGQVASEFDAKGLASEIIVVYES